MQRGRRSRLRGGAWPGAARRLLWDGQRRLHCCKAMLPQWLRKLRLLRLLRTQLVQRAGGCCSCGCYCGGSGS